MMFVGGGERGEGGFSVGAAAAGACVLQTEERRCVDERGVLEDGNFMTRMA